MIRAGFIRKVASGTYTYLPLGLRTLRKISQIVREEMDASGAQEIDMPFVQPMELWDEGTGRRADYGATLGWFTDRHGRENVLTPTAEEVVTSLVAAEINSYRQLPINLYQIKTKYRDEFRPRFGVLRSREFVMKDAYSFDATLEGLQKSYDAMHAAYCRIFERCGVPYVVVQAQAGEIGGEGSEEFMIPCDAGEDTIVHTADNAYAANIEKAETDAPQVEGEPLTGEPTGELEAVATPGCKSIEEVTAYFKKKLKTKLNAKNMLKTLVMRATWTEEGAGPDWVLAVVRGDHELNEHKVLPALRVAYPALDTVVMADEAEAAAAGFCIGYVSPGVPISCLTVIDPAAAVGGFWVAGGNQPDTHVKHFNWQRELVAHVSDDCYLVADIRNAAEGDTHNGEPLLFSRGIEVGHIFQLGTKYSEALDATFLDEQGHESHCIMGCYGIGINRIFAGAIEAAHDEDGCILPAAIAPFTVEVIPLNNDKEAVRAAAQSIYDELTAVGVDVLLDDRDARPGVKFKDADLIGIPLRVVVGERGLADGHVELKRRTDADATLVDVDQAVPQTLAIVKELLAVATSN